jgi:hypothetical protein
MFAVRFGVGVASGDTGKATEAAVGCKDRGNPVLAHQCSDVRVGHHVAADRVITDEVLIHLPEPVGLSGTSHVRTTDELIQVLPRVIWIQWLIETPGCVAIRR